MPGTGNGRGWGAVGEKSPPGRRVKEGGLSPANCPSPGVLLCWGEARQEGWRLSPCSRSSNNPFHHRIPRPTAGGFSNGSKKECHPDLTGRGDKEEVEDVCIRGLISAVPRGLPLRPGALVQEVPERVEEGR